MNNEEFELLLQKASLGCCPKEDLLDAKERLESAVEDKNAECADLAHYLTNITDALDDFKNFNKYTCFNNIRALLKVNPDVKIGMIEKEAGVRLGYMSRLEKPDNSSEPTLEFVATAADRKICPGIYKENS